MKNKTVVEISTTIVALKLIAELYKKNRIPANAYKEIMEKHGK